MAMPRKGRRTIKIAEDTFYWRAQLESEWWKKPESRARIYIEHAENATAKITASLRVPPPAFERPWGEDARGFLVTPTVIRQLIEHVMRTGWNPWTAKKTVQIGAAEDHVTAEEGTSG